LLIKYKFEQKTFHFSTPDRESKRNIFTVIVGKNGTGKSRLMQSVIEEFIGVDHKYKRLRNARLFSGIPFQENVSKDIEVETIPTKIIAVSTSPFDKFPLDIYDNSHENYTYLGLRSLRSTDLGTAYMANIYISLLKSVVDDSDRASKICEVLGFLGYSPIIQANYQLDFPNLRVQEALASPNPVDCFVEYLLSNTRYPGQRGRIRGFFDENKDVDLAKVERFLKIYSRNGDCMTRLKINIFLEEGGICLTPKNICTEDDFFFLADLGIARLREVILDKINGEIVNIGDASSGEQSVVMSVLGIASQICDDSLVCIDEPEICLHPEWQEKYIDILINTFKNFKGCHFLIATHSPLMVSKLSDDSCYLMKMENGKVIPASQINKRSVDFQLVNTFGTPGYKNEYLTRELISVLTIFGETGKLDDITKDKLKFLLSLKEKIGELDPVLKLMEMAHEALLESS